MTYCTAYAFAYDGAGNLTSTVDPTDAWVHRSYDECDLMDEMTLSSGESYDFAYDAAHRLTGIAAGAGESWTYVYNAVGWLTSTTDDVDGHSFGVTYAYGEAGRATGIAASDEGTRTYAYDLAGGLTSLALPAEASAHTTYAYDGSGARASATYPSGAVTAFGYDGAGMLASIATTLPSGVLARSYTRDAAGRVTAENDERYLYDAAGRLSGWYEPSEDATTTYAYDAAGSLTSVSREGTEVASFSLDAAGRITNAGFSFDDAGRMTSDGERDFSWDAAGRLVSVTDASTEATVATYAYDSLARRVSATDATGTVFFHYDGASGRVIAETDDAGEVLATYAYDDAGRLHAMTRDGATYYYHLSARGDVIALSDASGEVVNTYRYDPWGMLLEADEQVENPYRYASYRYDEATDLYACWMRYYAPQLGRFISKDPYPGELSRPETLNPYMYCAGDPVNAVDPSGMMAWAWNQYAMDSMTFAGTVGYTAALGYGLITLNPGVIMLAQLARVGVTMGDAVADAHWDEHTGGCRSADNSDAANWQAGKLSGGAPDLITGAAADFLRGLTFGITDGVNRLWNDSEYLYLEPED